MEYTDHELKEAAIGEVLPEGLSLIYKNGRLGLTDGVMTLSGDFEHMLSRIKRSGIASELIVKASGIGKKSPSDEKDHGLFQCTGAVSGHPVAVDATAGLGEDSFLLAAAGFAVMMYEKDPVIAALVKDALKRADMTEDLRDIAGRMSLIEGDSLEAMRKMEKGPDLILLDPMFPARKKSSLVKKKLQLIQKLEHPCDNEDEMMDAAISASPGRIVVKRPKKGPYLAGRKPSFSVSGKQIRYDCYIV